ncbi:hypothetical protein FPV67DRAFT_1484507 [Lyophyllum atratum]|nr:hypothetical protein FPV67DRAFT_1484507 [Lyophyllum atratum]
MFQSIDPTPVNVCRQVTCDKCKKTTWAGCGQHVETVSPPFPYAPTLKCACYVMHLLEQAWGEAIDVFKCWRNC